MKRWPGIFRSLPQSIIQPYSRICRTFWNGCICRNLAYSESWNIQNSFITASPGIFRTLSSLRKFTNIQNSDNPWHIQNPLKDSKWRFFGKIVKNYNYFSKALHLRSLTRFWIRPTFNKCSLTCRMTSSYYYMKHI